MQICSPSQIIRLSALLLATSAAPVFSEVTYTKDIAPILDKHCVVCHRAGQIAPMSLRTYEEVRPWAKPIRTQVTKKKMPPWFASADSVKFGNENTLSDEEIDLINVWIRQGAKKGNPKDMPTPPKFNNNGWSIGEPDLVVKMDKPFTIPDHEDDSQPTIQIKGTVDQDRWIKAIEVKPGNYELVHHTLVYLINADGARSNHPFGGGKLVGLYGPGFPPVSFPAEHGKLFKKNSNIVLNMHYHKDIGPGTAASDQTSVGMIFADGPVKNPVTTAWVGSQELNIPPFADNVESRAAFTFKDDGHILSLMPHLHYRGKDFSYTAEYPDGTVQTLLDVPEFDFNWQIGYVMKEPMPIPRGTVIRVIAHHDNSISNPYNPDPTQFVTWGSSTDDEMMIGFMDYTYASLKSQQTEFPDSPQAASSQRARKNASTGNATSRTLNKNVGVGRLLRSFDKNRDGKIEKSEIPEGFYGFFEDFDSNKDGYLTRDEL